MDQGRPDAALVERVPLREPPDQRGVERPQPDADRGQDELRERHRRAADHTGLSEGKQTHRRPDQEHGEDAGLAQAGRTHRRPFAAHRVRGRILERFRFGCASTPRPGVEWGPMWIVRLALRRPYTIAVLCSLIAIFGVLSTGRMKTDILPAIDIPVVIVVWNYPGLSAEDMERRVVFISERAMSTTVSGIQRIDSQSMSSIGILKVYFEPGSDIGGAIAQIVSVSLTASRIMPPGITPPAIIRYNASNVPVAQLTISSKTLSEQEIFDYGPYFIRLPLFTTPGRAPPAPVGGKQRQIMVDIDPGRVAAKGLSPNDVVQSVLQSNVLVPAGSAQIGGTRDDGQLNSRPQTLQGVYHF